MFYSFPQGVIRDNAFCQHLGEQDTSHSGLLKHVTSYPAVFLAKEINYVKKASGKQVTGTHRHWDVCWWGSRHCSHTRGVSGLWCQGQAFPIWQGTCHPSLPLGVDHPMKSPFSLNKKSLLQAHFLIFSNGFTSIWLMSQHKALDLVLTNEHF